MHTHTYTHTHGVSTYKHRHAQTKTSPARCLGFRVQGLWFRVQGLGFSSLYLSWMTLVGDTRDDNALMRSPIALLAATSIFGHEALIPHEEEDCM